MLFEWINSIERVKSILPEKRFVLFESKYLPVHWRASNSNEVKGLDDVLWAERQTKHRNVKFRHSVSLKLGHEKAVVFRRAFRNIWMAGIYSIHHYHGGFSAERQTNCQIEWVILYRSLFFQNFYVIAVIRFVYALFCIMILLKEPKKKKKKHVGCDIDRLCYFSFIPLAECRRFKWDLSPYVCLDHK